MYIKSFSSLLINKKQKNPQNSGLCFVQYGQDVKGISHLQVILHLKLHFSCKKIKMKLLHPQYHKRVRWKRGNKSAISKKKNRDVADDCDNKIYK